MRRAISFLLAGLPVSIALVAGCPAEAPPPRTPGPIPPPSVEAPPPPPPRSYPLADPDTHDGNDASAGMLDRVRWGATRVCLEAVEVADGHRTMREGGELETAVIARFNGKTSSAGRVGVTPGAELHQALSCKIGAPWYRAGILET